MSLSSRWLATLVALAAQGAYAPRSDAAEQPNVVFLLADDLGREDCGFMGGKQIKTPHLDKLAAAGARLDAFYVQPVCSPTRAAFMTGRYPMRHGLQVGVVRPWAQYGLPLEEQTLAQALKGAGYATAIVGKWHLGHFAPEYLPTRRGFDHQYGHYNGALDYFTHLREGEVDWHRNDETVKEEGYATDLLAREAVRFVEESPADQPFFLYVPFNAPHSPYQAKPDDLARYPQRQGNRRTYAAMVDSMDQAIGQVLNAIAKRADADNTFILFFSDNGGHLPVASNGLLRDGKFSVYEGGICVAAAVRWPAGGLKGGRVCAEPMGYIDVMPTALRLAKTESTPAQPVLDGIDVLDVMRGEKATPERPWFSFIAPQAREDAAVNVGPWKLVLSGTSLLTPSSESVTKVELFNLIDDPRETNDLAAQHPAHVARLRQHLVEFARLQKTGVAAYAEGRSGFKAPTDWIIKD